MKKEGSNPFGGMSPYFFPQYNIWVVSFLSILLHNKQKETSGCKQIKKAARAITEERRGKRDGRRKKRRENEFITPTQLSHLFFSPTPPFCSGGISKKSQKKKKNKSRYRLGSSKRQMDRQGPQRVLLFTPLRSEGRRDDRRRREGWG